MQNIQYEPLLNGLLHRVGVKGAVARLALLVQNGLPRFIHHGNAKHLQRFPLGRSRKGEVAGIFQQLVPLHQGVDFVLVVHLILGGQSGESQVHLRGGLSALAGVRLVDQDGESPVPVIRSDFRDDIREFLNGSDNDALSVCDGPCQIVGVFRPRHGIADLRELFQGVSDLLVQNAAVGDHDDGIQYRPSVLLQPDQLVGQPCDGVRLPATCAVLDQVFFPHAVFLYVGKELCYHIQLVIARKNLFLRLPFCRLIGFHNHLRVVFIRANFSLVRISLQR